MIGTMVRMGGAAALAVAALPVQAADTAAERNRVWAAGYRAAFTCSSLWNGAGKSLADIERDELTHIYPEIEAAMRTLKAEVDEARHIVRVAWRNDMPPRIAKWNGREGCVTFPIGTGEVPPAVTPSGDQLDLDGRTWPLGDRNALAADRRFDPVRDALADFGGRSSSLLIVKDAASRSNGIGAVMARTPRSAPSRSPSRSRQR